MSSVNKVILVGRLGGDPDVRQFQNGGGVTSFNLATSERWNDKQTGESREQTEWHRVSLFNKLGEIAANYLRKGSLVYIEGSLHTRKYTDQQGIERYSTEIRASQMQMLGSRNDGNGGQYANQNHQNSYENRGNNNHQNPQYGQYNSAAQSYNFGDQAGFGNHGMDQNNHLQNPQQNYQNGGFGNAPQASAPVYQNNNTNQGFSQGRQDLPKNDGQIGGDSNPYLKDDSSQKAITPPPMNAGGPKDDDMPF